MLVEKVEAERQVRDYGSELVWRIRERVPVGFQAAGHRIRKVVEANRVNPTFPKPFDEDRLATAPDVKHGLEQESRIHMKDLELRLCSVLLRHYC